MDVEEGQIVTGDESTSTKDVIRNDGLTQDEVIRRRLIIDGDGVGDDRKIHNFLKIMSSLVSSEDSTAEDDEQLSEKLAQQLNYLEYCVKRTHSSLIVNHETMNLYETIDSYITEESERATASSQLAKQTIEEETKNRKNSMEYEALTKLIDTKPDRKATESKKNILTEEVEKIKGIKHEMVDALRDRRRHIKALGVVVKSLQQTIAEDDFELRNFGNLSPIGVHQYGDIDPFPLEKEAYTMMTDEYNSNIQDGSNSNDKWLGPPPPPHVTSSSSNQVRSKYEDLSEESPEEGESED